MEHTGASFRSCSKGPGPVGLFGGAIPSAQPGVGGGGPREPGGEGGRRARGRVGMDNQHLGRNPSRWFPPSASEGSEIGPCELGGGSERRVCVRARTGRRGRLFPPAKETQPRGNGAERIIKAGKRRWERRGGAWGGGFTRPGSDYTALGASFPRSIPHTPALKTWTYPPRPPPGRASCSARAALPGGAWRSPAPAQLPALGDRCCRVSPKQLPRNATLLQPTWLAGIAFDVTLRGEVTQ